MNRGVVWLTVFAGFLLSVTVVLRQFPQVGNHATNFFKRHIQGDDSNHCDCPYCTAALPPGYHPPLQLLERWDDPKCGNWQHDYAKRHKSVMARNPEDQKLLVYQRAHLGLGDQLSVGVSFFLFALLSGRAFRIVSHDNVFNYSYSSPSGIEWTSAPKDLEPPVHTWRGTQNDFDYRFRSTNVLSHVSESVKTIYYNEGYAHAQLHNLFDNPHHKEELSKLGLRKETAFGCIFNFLFRPSAAVMKVVKPVFEELNKKQVEHPGRVVKIGVHMRFGDDAIKMNDQECRSGKNSMKWRMYHKCVSEVESQYDSGTKFVWLVVTDCRKAKDEIQKAYPDKVLKTPNPRHDVHYAQNSGLDGKDLVTAEHFLLGFMDVYVMPKDSTFSHTGGLRVWNESREYYTLPLNNGDCRSRESATVWGNFATEGWVHIR